MRCRTPSSLPLPSPFAPDPSPFDPEPSRAAADTTVQATFVNDSLLLCMVLANAVSAG